MKNTMDRFEVFGVKCCRVDIRREERTETAFARGVLRGQGLLPNSYLLTY